MIYKNDAGLAIGQSGMLYDLEMLCAGADVECWGRLWLNCVSYRLSHSFSQLADEASLGICQSPLGDSPQVPTLGPSGRHERLNCWLKNRRQNTDNHFFIVASSYWLQEKAWRASIYILLGRKPHLKT